MNNFDEVKNSTSKVIGLIISMLKDNSTFTTLKYYYKTDKKIFEQIKMQYLSKRWYKENLEIQVKEIAHNLRNTKSKDKAK